ncbi:MAG: DinB family protein [Ktedonobacteraceae bacterium]|nr:DinB family protein [Ktedonobacteraceae bacterium]
MTTGLSDFFRYNLWANLRLFDACTHLSDTQLDATMKGTFGSVRATLMHMLTSEEGYTRTLTGNIPTPPLADLPHFPGFDELRRRAEASGEALIAFAEHVEQERLSQILHLDGGTYDAPVIIVVIQAIDHGIDHRSQIVTLLSQQDIQHPELDSWAYNDATLTKS